MCCATFFGGGLCETAATSAFNNGCWSFEAATWSICFFHSRMESWAKAKRSRELEKDWERTTTTAAAATTTKRSTRKGGEIVESTGDLHGFVWAGCCNKRAHSFSLCFNLQSEAWVHPLQLATSCCCCCCDWAATCDLLEWMQRKRWRSDGIDWSL